VRGAGTLPCLVTHIHIRDVATGLALKVDELLLDLDHSLWIAARVALDVLFDERLQQLGQFLGVVCAVDDGRACCLVKVGLGTQLAAVKLEDVCARRRAGQCRSSWA
jgi:hypothetical protein